MMMMMMMMLMLSLINVNLSLLFPFNFGSWLWMWLCVCVCPCVVHCLTTFVLISLSILVIFPQFFFLLCLPHLFNSFFVVVVVVWLSPRQTLVLTIKWTPSSSPPLNTFFSDLLSTMLTNMTATFVCFISFYTCIYTYKLVVVSQSPLLYVCVCVCVCVCVYIVYGNGAYLI